MDSINVDGLPPTVVRSLENLVAGLKEQFTLPASDEDIEPVERMKRAAGSWADADEAEFDAWLKETYHARKMERREPLK